MRKFLREQGRHRCNVLSTRLMDDIAMSCDTIAIMVRGRIAWFGTLNELEAQALEVSPGRSKAEVGYLAVTGQ